MNGKEKLEREELEDIIKFSEGLAFMDSNYYSPFLSNELLQNLNTIKGIPSYDVIQKALVDFNSTPENLQMYNEFAAQFNMIFKRTLYSYVNSLALDLSYVCTNAYTKADYESAEYAKDKARVEDFLLNFDYKKEFHNVLMNVMRRETYFTWFRKSKPGNGNKKMRYALQMMPQDRCMITGYWEKGLLYSMDMTYFMQPGVDIGEFDPAVRKMYERVMESPGIDYKPSAPLNKRTGTYALWADASPMAGAYAFKMDPSTFSPVPFLASFVKNIIRDEEVERLQYNKDLISAYAILVGTIRLYDGAKSGEQKDQFAINLKLLGQLMAKAKSGFGSLVKLGAMPTEDNKLFQFEDKNGDMYKDQVATTAASGTGISRVIYSTDRVSAAELEAQQNEVYQTMRPMYSQFNNFMDFFVNQMTKKYKFKFTFDGATYRYDRTQRFEQINKLADRGIVLPPSAWASALGQNPALFEAALRESKNTGWLDKYSQLMVNINTTSQEAEGGRPREEGAVDAATEASRELYTD